MVANELTIYNATIFETRMATATLALKENFLAETLHFMAGQLKFSFLQ